MTQIYVEDEVVPVTIVKVPKNIVCAVGEKEIDGVVSVDIGLGTKKHPSKAEEGKFKKIKKVPRHVWTIWVEKDQAGEFKDSVEFGPDTAAVDDLVDVTGVTKAKGFAGVVKRYGFHGGPRTHGQSDRLRAPGSIGAGTDPGRVFPGKKMPGRMGGKTKTLRHRKIVGVGDDFVLIKGALPGNVGGVLKMKLIKKES